MEFNSYIQRTFSSKLNLQSNSQFQALLVDLLVSSVDLMSQGRVRALALEKFVFLVLHLDNPAFYLQFPDIVKMYQRDLEANLAVEGEVLDKLLQNPEFMLTYAVVGLAKNHNFFSQVDGYMKEFARISMGIPHLQAKLEEVLTREIAIVGEQGRVADQVKPLSTPIAHHNVLAQPHFQFLPKALKAQELQTNIALSKELAKTRQLRDLLSSSFDNESRLLSSTHEFEALLNKLGDL